MASCFLLFKKHSVKVFLSFFVFLLFSGCNNSDKYLVVYTSVDEVYSSKIFKEFEKATGIKIKPVYDVESAKAVGLAKRLLAEKNNPQADVFWNSEPLQTAILAKNNVFDSLNEINTDIYINSSYYDKHKRWFALGERYRVIIINKNFVKKEPTRLNDILRGDFIGKNAISYPYMGTTAAHFVALYHKIGEKKFIELLNLIKNSKTKFLAGNSVVKDMVSKGRVLGGIVDTDDANVGLKHNEPIKKIYYNQNSDGVFGIFSTVSLIKHASHPKEAREFIKFLLNKNIEKKLISEGLFESSVFKGGERTNIKSWTLNPADYVNDKTQVFNLLKNIL